MTDEQLTYTENKVLDLMEAGHGLADADALELDGDSDIKARCSETEAIATALRMESEKVDVEGELVRFHRKHAASRRRRAAVVAIVVAMAACFAGAVFILNRPEPVPQLKPGQVYVASDKPRDIVLKGGFLSETVVTARRALQPVSVAQLAPDLDTSHARELRLDVPEGKSLAVALPDGSRVWLHPGSTIYFPSSFDDDVRQVKLVGEAYFQVRHDDSKPFIVDAGGLRTTVLGTEFNVNTSGKNGATVVLVSGSVRVDADGGNRTLRPGMQAVAQKSGLVVMAADTEKYTNWRDGYFYFDKQTLDEILVEIGRNYGVTVECHDAALCATRLHFIARRDETLLGILKRLRELAPMSFQQKGNTLVVVRQER